MKVYRYGLTTVKLVNKNEKRERVSRTLVRYNARKLRLKGAK